MIKTLINMKTGESGIIKKINGGRGVVSHLDSLGIRIHKKVTKVSSMVMQGPITIQIDNSKIAIGRGMAKKILVEADKKNIT